jgi:hypothetical protein
MNIFKFTLLYLHANSGTSIFKSVKFYGILSFNPNDCIIVPMKIYLHKTHIMWQMHVRICFPPYRQVHQVELSHAYVLFTVRIFLATFYSHCEDCVGSRAVEIHVCGTNMSCLEKHNKIYTKKNEKKKIYVLPKWIFSFRSLLEVCQEKTVKQPLQIWSDKKTKMILTVFVANAHDAIHIIGIIDTECGQILHVHANIRPLFHLS